MSAPPAEAPAPVQDQSTAEQIAEILALVKAQAIIRDGLTDQAVSMAAAAARRFTGWYDHGAITDWAEQLASQIRPILRVLAQTTDAHQARVLSNLTGRRVRPGFLVDVTSLRGGGITQAGAYARATNVYRWQQSQLDKAARELAAAAAPQPPTLVSPAEAAVERAAAVARMDVQLAAQQQAQRVMASAHRQGLITGWRRVIHPELSRGGTCGLCVGAADRLYGAKEPMPLHDRCNCVPIPVREGRDPGSTLNQADLQRLYAEAGGTSTERLKDTRYQVNEHGELGPVLNRAGAPFRGPRQAKRDSQRSDRKPKTAEELHADLEQVRDGLRPALNKARELAAADPKKWDRYRSQLEARIGDLDHQLAA